ncbi:MAG TPA: hypothetical protein VJU82_05980 [Acidobacteriaceae bacterium]|nr:hypothetical protein [Acidobacteriaceae bacterium]
MIIFAWIGVAAVFCAAGWGISYLALGHFAGGNCTDTEQQLLRSPDGIRTIKSFHRECGRVFSGYFVYLSTGNPNKGYEYTPIAEFDHVGPGQVSARWNGPNEVDITYPISAKIDDVYAKVLGVRVVLNPPL